jgi:hypothetical protein
MKSEEYLTMSLLQIVEELAIRPHVIIEWPNYARISAYILGYMDALDQPGVEPINLQFTYWVQKAFDRKSNIRWPIYILNFMALEDEEKAQKILLEQLKAFLLHQQALGEAENKHA